MLRMVTYCLKDSLGRSLPSMWIFNSLVVVFIYFKYEIIRKRKYLLFFLYLIKNITLKLYLLFLKNFQKVITMKMWCYLYWKIFIIYLQEHGFASINLFQCHIFHTKKESNRFFFLKTFNRYCFSSSEVSS